MNSIVGPGITFLIILPVYYINQRFFDIFSVEAKLFYQLSAIRILRVKFYRAISAFKASFVLLFFLFGFNSIAQQPTLLFNLGGIDANGSPTAITTDADGSIYMVGSFASTIDFDPGLNTANLTSVGSSDGFVAKYNRNGQYLWAFKVGGDFQDVVQAISVDQNGDIVIIGNFRESMDVDPGVGTAILTSNGDFGFMQHGGGEIFVAKYSSAGHYLWAFNIGGTEMNEDGLAVETDLAGNVFIGGYFKLAADFDPSAGSYILNSANGPFFIAKYSAAGAFQWAFNSGLSNFDNEVSDIQVDNAGNVYATGYFRGSNIDFDPGPGVFPLTSAGDADIFILKYNSNGEFQFAINPGGDLAEGARGIDIDAFGSIYITGTFYSGNLDLDPGPGVSSITNTALGDIFLAKYNNNGHYIWGARMGGGHADRGQKVRVTSEFVYITGSFNVEADFDPELWEVDNLTSNGSDDIFLAKYTLDGDYVCSFSIGGTSHDFGNDLWPIGPDSILLTGTFRAGTVDFHPGASVSTLTSLGINDIFLAKYSWNSSNLPTGVLTGDTVCAGGQAQLTFTSTAGAGPFTLTYNNGNSNITVNGIQSGVPFNITPVPADTTVYALVSVKEELRCAEPNFITGVLATVFVNNCSSAAQFVAPDTICVNTPINIQNQTQGGTTHYWNFCSGSLSNIPTGTNFPSSEISEPVFMDLVQDGANYYAFVVNHTGSLSRMSFGNSFLNAPVIVNLGSFNGIIPWQAEGIEIQKEGTDWIGYLIGGKDVGPRLVRLHFGNSLANIPVLTNLGNIGNMSFPVDLNLMKEGNNWYAFTVDANLNSVIRFDFGNSLNNIPTASNLGNLGSLNFPVGIFSIKDQNNYYLFITNRNNNSLTRLSFGNSITNIPVAVNLGNVGGQMSGPRDINIIRDCEKVFGFVANELNSSIVRLDFNNDILNIPSATNLGGIGNLSFPHAISEVFRTGDAVNFFTPNVTSNSISRISFNNCASSSIPSSAAFNPPTYTYTQPGTYNVSLFIDDGLPTQATSCNQIVVMPELQHLPTQNILLCQGESIKVGSSSSTGTYQWSTGETIDSITINAPGIYWVETNRYGCVNRDSFVVAVINCVQSNGIVNDYTEVLGFDPCKNQLVVADAANYNVGDTVLLIQMKGAIIDTTNTANFGSIIDYRNAGNYEYNYIKQKNGNVLDLLNVVERQYDIPNGKVQLVRVPYYENLNVTTDITCLPWDGGKGGIVAFNVKNVIVMNGNIDVSGKGFRGGQPLNLTMMHCNKTDYFYPAGNNDGGQKGEGISEISVAKMYGRGALANGGGGGNSHNAGGAGGGNAGTGGRGGNQYASLSTCGTPVLDIGGREGKLLGYTNTQNRIFLGGGGGVGHANEQTDKKGGSGGGIILISASSLEGNLRSINANGEDVIECSGPDTGCANDGHSGGGAGGAILLNINNFLDSVRINANGGKGANAWFFPASFTTTGPGGGGGGGVIWYSQPANPAYTADSVLGGNNGIAIQQGNEPWGATSGQQGLHLYNLNLPIDEVPFIAPIVRTGNDTTFCEGGQAQLNTTGALIYSWNPAGSLDNPNIPNPIASPAISTQYVVTGTTATGCIATDTININILPRPSIFLSNDTVICRNTSIQLNASGGNVYSWSPTSTLNDPNIADPIATPVTNTVYYINVTGANTCSNVDSVSVSIHPVPLFAINPDGVLCSPDSLQLHASGGDIYTWQPSDFLSNPNIPNPKAAPQTTTLYSVTITESVCNESQTLSTIVTVSSRPSLQVSKSNDIDCTTPQSQLMATGAASYRWSPSSNISNPLIPNPIVTPTSNTWYKVEGADIYGCTSVDSVLVLSDLSAGKAGFFIPSAFTPNNDGKNDCFGVRYWGEAETFEMSIYNRWGQKVFNTTSINNCWDGTIKGIKQVSDVFVYQIRIRSTCSNGLLYKYGQVTLIR